MNEQELQTFLEENGDTIATRVREKMVEQIVETYRWRMPDTINEVVYEFMNEKIAPALREHLKANEGPLIQAAVKASSSITNKLAEKMIEKAVENMDSYRFGQTIKAIFD